MTIDPNLMPARPPAPAQDVLDAREREVLREAVAGAFRSMAKSVVVGSGVAIGGLFVMRSPLSAADHGVGAGGDYWYEASMPVVLFLLLGASIGLAAGWRLTVSGGMTGSYPWLIGIGGMLIVTLAAIMAAMFVFPENAIPRMGWLSIVGMFFGGAIGVTCFTRWIA